MVQVRLLCPVIISDRWRYTTVQKVILEFKKKAKYHLFKNTKSTPKNILLTIILQIKELRKKNKTLSNYRELETKLD